MSIKVDRVELEIVIKNDETRKRMRELDDEMINLQKEMKLLGKENDDYVAKTADLKSVKEEHKEAGKWVTKLTKDLDGLTVGTKAYIKKQEEIEKWKQSYKEIGNSVKNLKIELEGMSKTNEAWLAKKAELKEKKTEYNRLASTIDLNSMSLKELVKRQKELNIVMSNMPANSTEFAGIKKNYDEVGARIKELKTNAITTKDTLANMTTSFGKSLGRFALGFTTISAIYQGIVSITNNIMEFSKAVSELSALTGATGADLDWLKEKAKDLAKQYGKSATEIVTSMKLVGSAKPELLSNVQALSQVTESVLILSKASSMDLEDATKNLTTIMNQFGLSAIESDRTINVLAAGSKYGAVEVDYLGESISKVGTVANSAGLSLEQTTAMMELFGEKGVKAETAGTGFRQVLVRLQKDITNYTNGVFDLNKAIDNNQSIAGDNIALQSKFGMEFFNLAQILFQNKNRFKELTEQVTGTTTAEEQMRIATDNLSGDMGKLKGGWDAFMLSLEDGQGRIATTFRGLIQWTTEGINGLKKLQQTDTENEIERIANSASSRTKSFLQNMSTEKNKDGDTLTEQEKLNLINQTILAEKAINNQRIKQITELKKHQLELQNTIKNNSKILGKSTVSERVELKSIEDNIKKIEPLLYASNAYINSLGGIRKTIQQGTVIKKNTNNKDDDTDLKSRQDKELQNDEDKYKKKQALLTDELYNANKTEEQYQTENEVNELNYLENKRDKLIKFGRETGDIDKQIADKKLEIQKKAIADLEKLFKDYEKKRKDETDLALKKLETAEQEEKNKLDRSKMTEQQYKDALLAIEVKYAKEREALAISPMDLVTQEQNKELALLDERHKAGLISEKKYQEEVLRIKSEAFKQQLIHAGMSAEKAEELAKKTLALTGKEENGSNKKKDEQDFADFKAGDNPITQLEKQKRAELDVIQNFFDKQLINEEQAAKLRLEVNKKYDRLKIQAVAEMGLGYMAQFASAAQGFQQAEEMATTLKYDKLIKAAGKNQKQVTKLEEQKQRELAQLRADWAEKQFVMTAAQIVAQTALAAITAFTSTVGIPVVGPVLAPIAAAAAVAAGAAQLAVANQARDQAKSGLYSGGYSGDYVEGYTRRGNSRAEAGVIPIHSNEFVGNNDGVANPHVNQFYDIFNNAQKTGRIRMMNTTEILQNIRLKGMYDGGYSQTNRTTAQASGLVNGVPQSNNTMDTNRLTDVLTRLEAKMDKPMRGIVSITGREGLKEQTALYDRMIAAKSR